MIISLTLKGSSIESTLSKLNEAALNQRTRFKVDGIPTSLLIGKTIEDLRASGTLDLLNGALFIDDLAKEIFAIVDQPGLVSLVTTDKVPESIDITKFKRGAQMLDFNAVNSNDPDDLVKKGTDFYDLVKKHADHHKYDPSDDQIKDLVAAQIAAGIKTIDSEESLKVSVNPLSTPELFFAEGLKTRNLTKGLE